MKAIARALGISGGKKRGGRREVVILDFSQRSIILPNGDAILKDDIISFDPATGVLVYRSPTGEIKTVKIETGGGEPVEKLLEKLVEKAGEERGKSGLTMYT